MPQLYILIAYIQLQYRSPDREINAEFKLQYALNTHAMLLYLPNLYTTYVPYKGQEITVLLCMSTTYTIWRVYSIR
jgi:hypothetical protein